MGICNSSNKEDVRKDRERVRGNTASGNRNSTAAATSASTAAAQPQPTTSQPATQTNQPTQAQPVVGSVRANQSIPQNKDGEGEGEVQYGTSYTNRKTKEYDLLNDIVKQTRNNFIDVSAKSGALDEEDLIERGQRYVKHLSEIPSSSQSVTQFGGPPLEAFGPPHQQLPLPAPSPLIVKRTPGTAVAPSRLTGEIDYQALVLILASATIVQQDIELITTASQHTSAAIENMTLIDTGKVVLTFEEL